MNRGSERQTVDGSYMQRTQIASMRPRFMNRGSWLYVAPAADPRDRLQ